MSDNAKFYVGVKAIIMNDENEILILKSGPLEEKYHETHWDLPGGRIQEGESLEKTLRREVEEELGVPGNKLEINEIFLANISNFKKSALNGLYLMLISYKCKLATDSFELSDEHSQWKWAPVEEAKKLLSTKFSKDFIEKLDQLKEAEV